MVSPNAPGSQHPNKNVPSTRFYCSKLMSLCPRRRLYHYYYY